MSNMNINVEDQTIIEDATVESGIVVELTMEPSSSITVIDVDGSVCSSVGAEKHATGFVALDLSSDTLKMVSLIDSGIRESISKYDKSLLFHIKQNDIATDYVSYTQKHPGMTDAAAYDRARMQVDMCGGGGMNIFPLLTDEFIQNVIDTVKENRRIFISPEKMVKDNGSMIDDAVLERFYIVGTVFRLQLTNILQLYTISHLRYNRVHTLRQFMHDAAVVIDRYTNTYICKTYKDGKFIHLTDSLIGYSKSYLENVSGISQLMRTLCKKVHKESNLNAIHTAFLERFGKSACDATFVPILLVSSYRHNIIERITRAYKTYVRDAADAAKKNGWANWM